MHYEHEQSYHDARSEPEPYQDTRSKPEPSYHDARSEPEPYHDTRSEPEPSYHATRSEPEPYHESRYEPEPQQEKKTEEYVRSEKSQQLSWPERSDYSYQDKEEFLREPAPIFQFHSESPAPHEQHL